MKSECDDMSDQESKQCIQAIDRTSVHRICSGQVILNLASAIKELVENSLDAGATNIEVRLKDYGSELIEVVDNGEGVEEDNFIGLTLKHHTSKLKDFSDLVNTETFGFRGEALSSLCALSKMSIVTCHHHATVGTRLEYDSHGNIIKRLPYPRQRGTSVTLQNLFYTLPVRHKEFLRNLKREFSKAIHILNAYCIISTGVRISCTNQIGKGKKTTVVSTGGNTTLIENITNIFGAKQAQNLLSFTQTSPSEEICTEFNIKEEQLKKAFFQISGYVSSSEHGLGRSAADRQFYYINKRPCDPLKISRLVNEVYHMYNRHQYPFVVLDVSLAKDSVDVNVTPDKRQIFLQQEKLLLALLKSSLIKMFEPRSSLYKINDASSKKKQGCLGSWSFNRSLSESKSPSPHLDNSKCTGSLSSSLKRKFSSIYVKHSEASPSEVTAKSMKADLYVTSVTKSNTLSISSNINTNKNMSYHEFQGDNNESSVQSGLLQKTMYTDDIISISEDDNTQNSSGDHFISRDMKTKKLDHSCGPSEFEKSSALALPEMLDVKLDCFNKKHVTEAEIITSSDDLTSSPLPKEDGLGFTEKCGTLEIVENSEVSTAVLPEASQHCTSEAEQHAAQMPDPPDPGDFTEDINPDGSITVISSEYDKPASVVRKEIKIEFSMDRLRRTLTTQRAKCEEEKKYCRFRASIKLTDNHIAEDELKKEISKDMFSRMDILGQFNLGFIITRLDRDIFIIDQHASDEKYNFEELQKHTVIHGQKLIKPQILELTPANESILIENREIFHKNGFDLAIDENALPTQCVSLITMPVKGNWAFGREDIDELIFILSDSPGVMCRPSRIRQMFASKACRKSVMIGTALNKTEMKKIVCRMGELDQPWNCPHGRPTMRHLISLNILPD